MDLREWPNVESGLLLLSGRFEGPCWNRLPEQRRGEIGIERDIVVVAANDAGNFQAFGEFRGFPFDGCEQAQIQQRRTQIARNAGRDFHGAIGQEFQ